MVEAPFPTADKEEVLSALRRALKEHAAQQGDSCASVCCLDAWMLGAGLDLAFVAQAPDQICILGSCLLTARFGTADSGDGAFVP